MNNYTESVVTALKEFESAYIKVVKALQSSNQSMQCNKVDNAFEIDYPFHKCFVELEINKWVESVVDELESNFTVVDYHYSNTGGNIMLSTAKVWIKDSKRFVWVYMNEESCTISGADYIWDQELSNEVIEYDVFNLLTWMWDEHPTNIENPYRSIALEILINYHIPHESMSYVPEVINAPYARWV